MRARIVVFEGNITMLAVDAVVTAANNALLGGGVDGAIHRAAGPELLQECRSLGGCETGDAKITGGYRLPVGYVIHTVGPVWQGGGQDEARLLARCYRRCFAIADEKGLASIAFPAISTGVYGYPLDQATRIAVAETRDYMEHGGGLEQIVFACFDARTKAVYATVIDEVFPG